MRSKPQLTLREAALLAGWRERWQRVICSTAPANRPQAEAAISQFYRLVGEPVPAFLWMESPIAAADAIGGLPVNDKPEGLKRLKAQIGEPLASELQDRFGDKFGKQLTDWLRLRAVGWLERCVYDRIEFSSMHDVRRELNRLLSPEPVLIGLKHIETLMDAYCEQK